MTHLSSVELQGTSDIYASGFYQITLTYRVCYISCKVGIQRFPVTRSEDVSSLNDAFSQAFRLGSVSQKLKWVKQ